MQQLKEAGIESAALDARLLLQHAMGLSREDILLKDPTPNSTQTETYTAYIVRRTKHEPVAKIIGKKPEVSGSIKRSQNWGLFLLN